MTDLENLNLFENILMYPRYAENKYATQRLTVSYDSI